MNLKHLIFAFLIYLSTALSAHCQNTYQLYMRLTDGGGVISGPISSIPNVTGGNFFALGCTEHQFNRPAGVGSADHEPYLATRNFDPGSSPYLRQQMNNGASFTVEIYMVEDNGSTQRTIFATRMESASITRMTIGADANALQETFSFEYNLIYWTDVQANRTWGWDLVNNRAI